VLPLRDGSEQISALKLRTRPYPDALQKALIQKCTAHDLSIPHRASFYTLPADGQSIRKTIAMLKEASRDIDVLVARA